MDDDDSKSDALRDPVYALQVLPNCRIVEISNSIKGLAKIVSETPEFQFMLQQTPKGTSLVIQHALAPGTCKGQRDPKLARRARLVADAISELWKKRFPAARKDSNKEQLLLLLQIMQFSPDVAAVVSLSKCQRGMMLWPNPNFLPVGLANVDIDMKMPSSALSETS
jgi:hypothetical protein